jgi:hypothetical protein
MRSCRASCGSARPLNCGVMRLDPEECWCGQCVALRWRGRPSFSRRYGAAVLRDVFAAPLGSEALALLQSVSGVGLRSRGAESTSQAMFNPVQYSGGSLLQSRPAGALQKPKLGARQWAVLSTSAGYRSTSPVVSGFAAQTGQAYRVSAARVMPNRGRNSFGSVRPFVGRRSRG